MQCHEVRVKITPSMTPPFDALTHLPCTIDSVGTNAHTTTHDVLGTHLLPHERLSTGWSTIHLSHFLCLSTILLHFISITVHTTTHDVLGTHLLPHECLSAGWSAIHLSCFLCLLTILLHFISITNALYSAYSMYIRPWVALDKEHSSSPCLMLPRWAVYISYLIEPCLMLWSLMLG